MRVLFVRPRPPQETIGLQHVMIVEPLELEILATGIQSEHTVRIIDMILETASFESFLEAFNPDILCLTGYITHIPVIQEYCQRAKLLRPEIITVTGGVHTELFPEDIDHAAIDYRVVRNAVAVFPKLLLSILAGDPPPPGVLKQGESCNRALLPEHDYQYIIPDRSLTAPYRDQYFYVYHDKVALIKTSFGCPYTCTFCFCRQITDGHYFERSLTEVIEELRGIKEQEIYIVDDDFLLSRKRIETFIGLLKEQGLKKKFLVYGRADFVAANGDLIKAFHEVGLRTIIIGLESFSNQELSGYNKLTSSDTNRKAMEVLNETGVDCYAAVITPPDWAEEEFKQAGDIMLDLGIKFVNLQPLTPLKGTEVDVDESQLVLSRSDFARWDLAHVAIKPERLSLQQYYQNIMNLYERILFRPLHLLSHMKYSWRLQWRMFNGLRRVHRQYGKRILAAADPTSPIASPQPNTPQEKWGPTQADDHA